MQKKIGSLEDLRSFAFKIDEPIKVRPLVGKHHKITPYFEKDVQKGYCIHEGMLVFVDGAAMYVLPYFNQGLDILKDASFLPKEMFVPFSDGSVPIASEDDWKKIVDMATQYRIDEFQKQCKDYAKTKKIPSIPKEILDKCTERPLLTYIINHIYSVYSGIPTLYFDVSKIGTYTVYDGRYCTFVHTDGKTYHSDRIDVYKALIDAGYTSL